ncbi:ankyrin repeat-containing domain protein [Melampsora americana]|nr:ankyrin repeat-containing domain protein [Melampsora americana]
MFDIHRSAYEGQDQLVAAALSEDPSRINTIDADGRTPLHNACSSGSTSVVRVLLDQTEPKCDIEKKDNLGWTALIIAVSAGITEVVSDLIHSGADVNAVNEKGMTALHYAASKGRLEIGRLLIRYGADINARDRANQLPLHRAASSGAIPFIRLLVNPEPNKDGTTEDSESPRPKPRLNLVDRAGHTPLHLAFESGHGEAACVLIEAGADRGRLDSEGRRPDEVADVLGDLVHLRLRQYVESRCGKYE